MDAVLVEILRDAKAYKVDQTLLAVVHDLQQEDIRHLRQSTSVDSQEEDIVASPSASDAPQATAFSAFDDKYESLRTQLLS